MDEDSASENLGSEARKRSMRAITLDGMAYSVMAGLGDAYLPAALVLLGAGDFMIGLLAALPQFLGAALQFFSLTAIRIVKSRKLLVMAGSALQALTWLGIAAMVFWPTPFSVEIIIALFSLGVGTALFVNPAWTSWVADIVHSNERAAFFANRNRLMQVTLFVVIFGAGYAIRELELGFSAAVAFAVVFFVAFAARALSVWFHARTEDVPYEIKLMNEIKLRHLFLLPSHKNELWFLAFVALMGFSVQFASPFFTPYILNDLRLDIGALGVLIAITIIAKIASFPYWGAVTDRFSNRVVLIATAFSMPLIPFVWLFSTDFWTLALFQAFAGFVWAGYELAMFNSALGLVGRDLRPSFISKYNSFAAFASGLGAISGGAFLFAFPDVAILGFSGILLVFLISAVMRLVVAIVFTPHIARGKDVANRHEDRAMVFRIVAVYPTQGAVHQVMHGWDFTRKIVSKGTETSGEMLRGGIEATGKIVKDGERRIMTKIGRRGRL